MRISEIIARLEAELERVGDVEVGAMTDEGSYVERIDPVVCSLGHGLYELSLFD